MLERLRPLDHAAAHRLNAVAHRWPVGAAIVALSARHTANLEVALMLWLGLRGRVSAATRMVLAVGVIYGLVEMAGARWQRQRPFAGRATIRPLVVHDPNRSFPSRHVASAVAMAAIAAPAAPATSRLMAAMAALLGVSRVAAGVHYPSDVLVGALLGSLVGRTLRGRR